MNMWSYSTRKRPVRREAVFQTDADNAAPAGFARGVEHNVGAGEEAVILVVGNGSATLHVEQGVIPGVAHLTGEQAERVDLVRLVVAEPKNGLAFEPLKSAQLP